MIELLKRISEEGIVIEVDNGQLQLSTDREDVDKDILSQIKDELGEDFDGQLNVAETETASLGEMAKTSKDDEKAESSSFTDQDYSNYNPDEDKKQENEVEQETVTDKAGIDEDTLYDSP